MATTLLTPLSINVPIIDPATGNPTPYFQRLLQQLLKEKAITDDIAEDAAAAIVTLQAGKADKTTTLTAGAGLTGGGDLSADRTFNVGAGTGILANANDVALDTTYVDEKIRDIIGAALVAGSNITITVNDGGDTITIASTASGGGAMTLIGTSTATLGTETSLSVSSISGAHKDLVCSVTSRGNVASPNVNIRLNNDSSNLYNIHREYGGVSHNFDNNATTSSFVGLYSAGTGGSATLFGSAEFVLPNYASTAMWKPITGISFQPATDTTGYTLQFSGVYRSTTAITRVDALTSTGAFNIGSILKVWGRA